MSETVKCTNRICGLITNLDKWLIVPRPNNANITELHCPRCGGKTYCIAKPGEKEKLKTGADLIALERRRQVRVEGYTPEKDDQHKKGELAMAAASYATEAGQSARYVMVTPDIETMPKWWPWQAKWWKPSDDAVQNLVKAGALIAAEIDRLQRKANRG